MRVLFTLIVGLIFLAVIAGLGCAFGTRFAHGRDNGQYGNVDPSIRDWVQGLTDQRGWNCCSTADGYPAEVDWDTDTGKYRVKIDGAWYVVPDSAVITKPNRLGYAVVWYWYLNAVPQIRCFLPGGGT